jgi:hypothetical protein
MTFKSDAEKLGMSIAACLHQLYQLTTSLFVVLVTSYLGFDGLLLGFIFNNVSPLLRHRHQLTLPSPTWFSWRSPA